MIEVADKPRTGQESVWRAGHTLWLYDEALRCFREDLLRMSAGDLRASQPLEAGKGMLEGVNKLIAHVSVSTGRHIVALVDQPETGVSTGYPLTSTRLLEHRVHNEGGDPGLEGVLRSYAQLALLFPDMLGPGRGGEKGDFVDVRCNLIPDLLCAVSGWLKDGDPARSHELGTLVGEWNAATGYA